MLNDLQAHQLLESMAPGAAGTIEELSRQDRMEHLADILQKNTSELIHELAAYAGLPTCIPITKEVVSDEHIPLRLIHDYQCFPIQPGEEKETPGDGLNLVTLWPPNEKMNKWVFAATGKTPRWHLAEPREVTETITEVYGVGASSLEDTELGELSEDESTADNEDENAAIIRFINEIIFKAIDERATDIHFEPQKESLQIRYRVDGQLDPVRVPENLRQYQSAIISRLKIMARLNIAEKRRPQDGRIGFQAGREPLDIRISTLPTMYGESVSLRLLNKNNRPLTVGELGLLQDDEKRLLKTADKPHGIILATGPTGSGKSTTLTAILSRIYDPKRRIMTVEDPVEYEVPGVNQTQVHSSIGLDFAQVLRTVLRQDPDVIMVGEIRDRETADIAIRASLTGHLVLSTLHTNDSAGALTRLTDMGIETFLIASSVELIVAQRLLRRINPAYPVDQAPSLPEQDVRSCLKALGVEEPYQEQWQPLISAEQTEAISTPLYRGRIGVFELLPVTESIHEHIVSQSTARMIRKTAIQEGMRTIQQCAWEQCKRKQTTLEEAMRFADTLKQKDDT